MSSWQLDRDERGFSVNSSVLDMRMSLQNPTNAFEIVNFAPQSELERIFSEFGELKAVSYTHLTLPTTPYV